jgi:hypothetical protein
MSLTPREWLGALTSADQLIEHLESKGSIIKFCVVHSDSDHEELRNCLDSLCDDNRMNMIAVDASRTDVSAPENIVRFVANSFKTEQNINTFVRYVWREATYDNEDLKPLMKLATDNDIDKISLNQSFESALRRVLPRSSEFDHVPAFNRDFRNALIKLASITREEGATSPIRTQLVNGFHMWLTGMAPAHILKMLGIQWKLRRTNATQILRSVLALAPLNGFSASVFHLDLRYVTNAEISPAPALIKYTKNRRTGTYQWLRELIDQTHMFDSTMIVVEVGPSFLDQSATGPGIGRYDALKFRVLDDIVTDRDNPSSVITKISE